MQHRGQHFGRLHTPGSVIAPAGNNARQIMVAPEQAVPAAAVQLFLPFVENRFQFPQIQRFQIPAMPAGLFVQLDLLKLEDHAELAAGRVGVKPPDFRRGAPALPHGQQVFAAEGFAVHLLQVLVQARAVLLDALVGHLADEIDDIHPETADAQIDPEVHHLPDFPAQRGVLPVEVRLLFAVEMQVIFARFLGILPGAAPEIGLQVVGRAAVFAGTPDVEIPVGACLAAARLLEPAVFIGSVVDHQIHNDPDAPRPALGQQLLHLVHGAVFRGNIVVIRNVVAVVRIGGTVNRAEPEHIDAQFFQIPQF